ncbi:hypothetical protein Dcae01_03310 [Deinococcus caeni]|uniref:Transposase n=2 Tax=Deinococcus caeni TaxID=569127 RepID=A0ABP9UJ46_9DEIO
MPTSHQGSDMHGSLEPVQNPNAPTYQRPFPPSRRCSLCRSTHADTLNGMLLGTLIKLDGQRYNMREVAAWAASQGVSLSKAAVSRHYNRHLLPAQTDQGTQAQPLKQSGVSKHIRRAAESLVTGLVEMVRNEFAAAVLDTTQAMSDLREPPGPESSQLPAATIEATTELRKASHEASFKGRRKWAVPKTLESAHKLEAALNRIQVMPVGMRGPLFEKLSREYGTDPNTVRRWLRQYEQDGLGGILRVTRSDRGHMRLPADQVRGIMEVIEAWPTLSNRKLYALLSETRPELLELPDLNGKARRISSGTIAKLARQIRHPISE